MKTTLVAGSTISTFQDDAPRGHKRFIVRDADMAGGKRGEPQSGRTESLAIGGIVAQRKG